MAKELYKNVLSRLPSAIAIAAVVFGILYLQNLIIICSLIFAVIGFLCREWLHVSSTKINLKQIIFFMTPMALFGLFGEIFINYFLLASFGFWSTYGFLLILKNTGRIPSLSFNNNYLGIFLMQAFVFSLIAILQFSNFSVNNFFVLFLL